jgi:superoxide reductase
VPHPNGTDHYITFIELYANGAPIARVDLTPVVTHPKVSIPVSLPPDTVVRAVEHCNLHGLWAYEVTI